MSIEYSRSKRIRLAGTVRYIGKDKPFYAQLRRNIERSPLHSHSYFEIELVVSGRGSTNINGTEYPIERCSVSCVAPTDFHDINTTVPIDVWNLAILDIPEEAEGIFSGTERMVKLTEREFDKVCALLNCIEDEQKHPLNDGVVELCFDAILRIIVRSVSLPVKRADPVFDALSYIRMNFCERITETDIADHVGFTVEHLSRKFKKIMGIGLKEYITSLRISYAVQLMDTTDMPLTDIAFESGFGSYTSFYRAFIQETGSSPTAVKSKKIFGSNASRPSALQKNQMSKTS